MMCSLYDARLGDDVFKIADNAPLGARAFIKIEKIQ